MAEMKILTQYIGDLNQCNIATYEKNGGYQAVKKAIPAIQPETLIDMVKRSELRGRGGAGFLTGMKWAFIPKDAPIRYLVCNCDESEPGTFKDRHLIENDPHQLVEGIILASYAINAHIAFIYCRGEFYEGIVKLRKAVAEAKSKGYIGSKILGSNYSLEVIVHPGAGAYIAGEETAQLSSLEGYRALPKLKPPFPAAEGLYRKPTIINNVETLCNVVHIVNKGVEWFTGIGKAKNTGTKIFQVSGQVQKPGCFEYPLGVHLREVLEAAGGCFPGRRFKACFPGGSSSVVLTQNDLDIAMDFDTLVARGSALGTASIIVMDDTADMVAVAHRLMEFYQNESCGKCTPCREGTRWSVQMLARILNHGGVKSDLKVIRDVCKSMEATSFCPLAVGASFPIVSVIEAFKDEFEAYINKNPKSNEPLKMQVNYPYV